MMSTSGSIETGIAGAGLKPAPLLVRFTKLLQGVFELGPVLDLACGLGQNGLYLASLGASVVLADWNRERLALAKSRADQMGVAPEILRIDLESGDPRPLPAMSYGTILVFRYLHRPLIPNLKEALKPGGILVYETFTTGQRKYGKPRNPDHLLNPGELSGWFENWDILFAGEGELDKPKRMMAQIVCRKKRSAGT